MPRTIVVAIGLLCLSCSQEKPTAQPVAPYLQEAKVSGSDECPTQAFNIELQFFDNVSYEYQVALQRAANRWEGVIRGNLPYITFWTDPLDEWNQTLKANVYFRGTVDDLRIIVRSVPLGGDVLAASTVLYIRTQGELPIISGIALNETLLAKETPANVERTMMHEIGHCLGIGTIDPWYDLVQEWPKIYSYDDPHFDGPFAKISYDAAGGSNSNYKGKKVPLDPYDAGHWRNILGDELMTSDWIYPYRQPISEITIAALSDIGYHVSYWGAEHYAVPTLPTETAKANTERDKRPRKCNLIFKPPKKK